MAITDSFLIGENWISEHYFGTEATSQSFHARILERRKHWEADEKAGHPTARTRFAATRGELVTAFAGITAALSDGAPITDLRERGDTVRARLFAVLGFDVGTAKATPDGDVLTRVSPLGATGTAPLVVVGAEPVDSIERLLAKDEPTLRAPTAMSEDGEEYVSAARLTSALFVDEHAPDLVLVLAGRWALLAERERWPEGRYLAIDVQAVAERNDTRRAGEVERMLICLAAESLVPGADGELWWRQTFDESIKHTVGVSADLREGIRLSIEIIANDVVTRRAARGLDPLPAEDAQPLARQALRFLYRILFLLYAEASSELGVLPSGAQDYEQGYGLDRLRDLVQVELTTPQAVTGTHLYESLATLFRLVERGHGIEVGGADDAESDGLVFHPLRSDLFRSSATALIDAVGLSNAELQRVLRHLLLSKEKRGRDRGFISYAELGINQLGAVYEGLMSYTGFFATTDLYEVAKNGDASKGSWVVATDRTDGIRSADFVQQELEDGRTIPVLHERGTFVFRLAGRERQQSASYYTPEVLTRFTVGQALAELLDQDGTTTSADNILGLTVCEPALGSGAFAIEAVRQLAGQYLDRRQAELGTRIDPDDYPRELQRVKAYLALHNVYGVDLNATAVELAEISLWLDTMAKGLSAPWFGLHLRRGNSLIGARRAIYSRQQVNDKSWLTAVPREMPLASLAADADAGEVCSGFERGIHHFLLPADGWGAAADAKEAAALEPDAAKALKDWRRSMKAKPTKAQLDDLSELAHRVEVLWQFAYRRLQIAEQEIRRAIPVWGADDLPAGGAVQREQIETALADADGAYRRVKRVMDAWCALWFWPLTDQTATVRTDSGPRRVAPPTLAEWIVGLQALLGRAPEARRRKLSLNNQSLSSAAAWDDLGVAEVAEMGFSAAEPVDQVLRKHRWLMVCERVAEQQGFFHWNLEFAPVFARGGGFDLQVGNPPWVRPDWSDENELAEFDARWAVGGERSPDAETKMKAESLSSPPIARSFAESLGVSIATRAATASLDRYPHLQGLRTDLYRCFMELVWQNQSPLGVSALVHPDSHLNDARARVLRRETYRRLRRFWLFINQMKFFEIDNNKPFAINVYGKALARPDFLMSTSLYHPDTLTRSLVHDGSGPEPGAKSETGKWDLSAHRGRVVRVTIETLSVWRELLEADESAIEETPAIYAGNRSSMAVLQKMAAMSRIGGLNLHFSQGWNETTDERRGLIAKEWGPCLSWEDVVLQGPNFFVANPFAKQPNRTMRSNRDWSRIDLETLDDNAIPVTSYKPSGPRGAYDAAYSHWRGGDTVAARGHFRIAWRSMANNTAERTLIPIVIPPGAAQLSQSVYSAGTSDDRLAELMVAVGVMSSLCADLSIRAVPKSAILMSAVNRLPNLAGHPLGREIALRMLRLNCLTMAYADLWRTCYDESFGRDEWAPTTFVRGERPPISVQTHLWNHAVPLRNQVDRRQALVEVDAAVAVAVGVSADELCSVYRTQFAVLVNKDRAIDKEKFIFDSNGRLLPGELIPVWRRKADAMTLEERTATSAGGSAYVYELPFITLDREADMRQAHAEFERRLAERSPARPVDQDKSGRVGQDDAGA